MLKWRRLLQRWNGDLEDSWRSMDANLVGPSYFTESESEAC
jgi:hypothetical protein